jgi:hypothetical protein
MIDDPSYKGFKRSIGMSPNIQHPLADDLKCLAEPYKPSFPLLNVALGLACFTACHRFAIRDPTSALPLRLDDRQSCLIRLLSYFTLYYRFAFRDPTFALFANSPTLPDLLQILFSCLRCRVFCPCFPVHRPREAIVHRPSVFHSCPSALKVF